MWHTYAYYSGPSSNCISILILMRILTSSPTCVESNLCCLVPIFMLSLPQLSCMPFFFFKSRFIPWFHCLHVLVSPYVDWLFFIPIHTANHLDLNSYLYHVYTPLSWYPPLLFCMWWCYCSAIFMYSCIDTSIADHPIYTYHCSDVLIAVMILSYLISLYHCSDVLVPVMLMMILSCLIFLHSCLDISIADHTGDICYAITMSYQLGHCLIPISQNHFP